MASNPSDNHNKKRSFSDWKGGDYYLCVECDTVHHGPNDLCEHLAKHTHNKRQARKRICLRVNPNENDVLDYQKTPQQLIPHEYVDDSGQRQNDVSKLCGVEQLAHSKQMNDYYYTYHQLRMAMDSIIATRRASPHSMRTSLDILHDVNELRRIATELSLPCAKTDLFQRIQARFLGNDFKQPTLKTNHKIVKKAVKPEVDGDAPMSEQKYDTEEHAQQQQKKIEEKEITFKFDASDLQRYLDANSEIIGRLQAIRKEKSFYGVTQEEVELNEQFARNTAAIVQYSSLPSRLLV